MKTVQVEQTMKRKIVRIKRRTVRSIRKKTIKKVGTKKKKDESADWISGQKKVTTTAIIAHTLSFDDENENTNSSGDNKSRLVRLVWTEKRKAMRDSDSKSLHASRKRVKLEKVDYSGDKKNPTKSKFQPDYNLIISWL